MTETVVPVMQMGAGETLVKIAAVLFILFLIGGTIIKVIGNIGR